MSPSFVIANSVASHLISYPTVVCDHINSTAKILRSQIAESEDIYVPVIWRDIARVLSTEVASALLPTVSEKACFLTSLQAFFYFCQFDGGKVMLQGYRILHFLIVNKV